VEHVIAGGKRCRIVHDVLRNTKAHFDDLVMEGDVPNELIADSDSSPICKSIDE
jgi:hypothetical protein